MSTFGSSTRTANLGVLLMRSFENLWLIRARSLAYLAVVAVWALIVTPFVPVDVSALALILYLAGQYWLYHGLLKARGMIETPRHHALSFAGLALLLIVPIAFGLALLMLPGLFLVARWIAAPSYVVARGHWSVAAATESWRAVRGHTLKLMVAVIIMFVMASILGGLTDLIENLLGSVQSYRLENPVSMIELHFLPLMLLGLSTATYEQLGPQSAMIEEVFG